jgi:Ser/Thr protein kinase RdoA (MazF antagonist)
VEAWALKTAQAHGLNVPTVVEHTKDADGHEVLRISRINGRSLRTCVSQESCEAFTSVGRQLSRLRGAGKGFGWIDPTTLEGTSSSWPAFLTNYAQTYGSRLVRERLIRRAELDSLLRLVASQTPDIGQSDIIHRDIKPANLLLDLEGKTWILDWENVMFGDGLYDLALFGMRFGHGHHWQHLVGGYGLNGQSSTHRLYEQVALVGMIDFLRIHQLPTTYQIKRLHRLLRE